VSAPRTGPKGATKAPSSKGATKAPSKGATKAAAPQAATKLAPKRDEKPGTRVVDASFLAGAAPGGTLPAPVHVEVAFAGRSNVGKSSLINTLLERKSLVRTSSTPGSTRQVNLYEAKLGDGTLFHLVDLPGYGFTHRSKREQGAWKELIEGYLSTRATLAAVVLLVDVRRGLEADDLELVDFVQSTPHPSRRPVALVVAATKLDKIPRAARRPALEALRKAVPAPAASGAPRLSLVGFSSETAEGREELWSALRRLALGRVEE
jgi:GTP-binding protein